MRDEEYYQASLKTIKDSINNEKELNPFEQKLLVIDFFLNKKSKVNIILFCVKLFGMNFKEAVEFYDEKSKLYGFK